MTGKEIDLIDVDEIPSGINNETAEYIKNYIKKEETKDLEWDHTSSKVTVELCDTMNKLYDKGLTAGEIADMFDLESHTTVHYHVQKKCTHEYRSKVTHSECGWMRFHANNGAPTKTLATLYDLSEKHTRTHVLGKCSHDHECPTPSPSELRSNGYGKTDMQTSTCPICEEEFEHEAYFNRTTCSEECKYKYIGRKSAEARAKSD